MTSSSALAQQRAKTALDKDLAVFADWFEGRYDNALQVFWETEQGAPQETRHGRIHSIFRRADLPAFGDMVFYVEQYADGDPQKIYRQRIYAFTADEKERAIRLTIHTPKKPEKLAGAYKNLALLRGLKPRNMLTREGCDVFWRRQANQFIGSMKQGACRFYSERFGKEIVISDDLVLTDSEIWIADRAQTLEGAHVFGDKNGAPHKLRKIRPFECWTALLRGAVHGDNGKGGDDWDFRRGGWLHDQGGELALISDENPARKIRLRLRRVEWPTGSNRPSLTLYVHEGDNERAVSYAWGEYDAERIGINLRWLQASCTYAPQRLYEDGR